MNNNNNNVGFFINVKEKIFSIVENTPNNKPIYFKAGILPNNFFLKNEKINIIDAVNFFKKIRKNINSEKITIQDIKNPENQKELMNAAVLSGFSSVLIRDWEDNIEALAIPTSTYYKKGSTVFFYKKNNIKYITVYIFENNKIKNTVTYSGSTHDNLIYIAKFLLEQKIKNIEILGDFNNMKEIKHFFFSFKIKVSIYNIWQNFFTLESFVPSIFKIDSHFYIKPYLLSLTDKTLESFFKQFYDYIGLKEWKNNIKNYNDFYSARKKHNQLDNIKKINIRK